METALYKLGLGIAPIFIMPLVGYIVGLIWLTVIGARELERTWRMCCLLFPIMFSGMMLAIRFDIIRGAWQESPVLAGIIYSCSGIVVPFGLIVGAIRLWRTPNR